MRIDLLKPVFFVVFGLIATTIQAQEGTVPSPAPAAAAAAAPDTNGQSAADKEAEKGRSEKPVAQPADTSGTTPGNGKPLAPAAEPASPVTNSDTYKQFVEYLKNRKGQDYSISSIRFNGAASEDHADLTATIQVSINRENEWIPVSLGMNEASLREAQYDGAGEHSPEKNFSRDKGYRWWFKGKGLHQLTLTLIVPIDKPSPTRRLTLAVPPAAVSELEMTIPVSFDELSITPPDAWFKKTASGKNKSKVELTGLNQRIDLQWESTPVATQSEKELRATTSILINPLFEGNILLMEAQQTVRAARGTMSEFVVQLPRDFHLDSVQGKHVLKQELLGNDKIKLFLKEPTRGPVELTWRLESNEIDAQKPLVINGFSINEAGQQTGEIGINALGNYSLSERSGDSRHVHRINARDWSGNSKVDSAYLIRQQPFRLELNLGKVEPYFNVRPQLFLYLTDKRIELVANFQVDVSADSGALQEVKLNWPHRIAEGWQIEPTRPDGLVKRIEGRETQDDTLTVQLAKRQTASFAVQLRAYRTLNTNPKSEAAQKPEAADMPETVQNSEPGQKTQGDQNTETVQQPEAGHKSFNITLPTAVGSSVSRTALVVANAENITSEILPLQGTYLRTVAPRDTSDVIVPDAFQGLRRTDYQIDSVTQELTCRLEAHDLRIETQTEATTSLEEFKRLVTQQLINYNVEFERLSEVRLMVPTRSDIDKHVRFSISSLNGPPGATGIRNLATPTYESLTPEWTGRDIEGYRQARLALPQSRIHQFAIKADFDFSLDSELTPGQEAKVSFPLVLSSDAEFDSATVHFEKRSELDVSAANSTLQRHLPDPRYDVWKLNTGITREVALAIRYTSPYSSQDYTIRRAWIETAFDNSGQSNNVAHYQIEGLVNKFILTIPEELIDPTFFWNGEPVSAVEAPADSRQYSLRIEPIPGQTLNLLTIRYHIPGSGTSKWQQQQQLYAPLFPPNVWVARTIWEVTLPLEQHLFTQPDGFTPEYTWERNLFIWSRQSTWTDEKLRKWMQPTDVAPVDSGISSDGNTYAFSHFGPATKISFRSMSQSFIILIGAGVALAFGFVLIRFPATRNILTLLSAAFVLALLSLWFSASVKLLIQPAGLGILLAFGANAVDGWLKKRKPKSMFPIPASNDFAIPHSAPSSFEFHVPHESSPHESSMEESPTIHSVPPSNSNSGSSPSDAGTSFEIGHNA